MTDRASRHVLSTHVPPPPPGRPFTPHQRTPALPENKTKPLRHGHVPRCDTLCRPKDDGFPQSAWSAAPAVVTGGGWWRGGYGTAVGTTAVSWPTACSWTAAAAAVVAAADEAVAVVAAATAAAAVVVAADGSPPPSSPPRRQ